MSRSVLIIIPVLSSLIAPLFAQRKISGGSEVKITDYPFAVNIFIRLPDSDYSCGGIYIDDVWVLSTYEYCFESVVGKHDLGRCCMGSTEMIETKCKYERKIVSVKHHPDYPYIDLSMVKIESAFPLGNTIKYGKLPTKPYTYDDYKTDNCVSIGWGLTGASETYSKNLKSSPEKIAKVNNVKCVFEYICSNGGACVGDYGGALVCNEEIVGVITHTLEDCGGTTYSVNIGLYLYFIDSTIHPELYGIGLAHRDKTDWILFVVLISTLINIVLYKGL